MPILPWTIRNWLVFGKFIPISTTAGAALYSSYFPPEGKFFGFVPFDENMKYAYSLDSETAASDFLLKKTIAGIKQMSFTQFVRLEFLKVLYFFSPFDWEILGGNGIYNFFYGFISPFFILGIFLSFKKMKDLLPVFLPLIYVFLMTLITYGSPRFRLPIEPYLIILAAVGISYFIKLFSKKIFPISLLFLFFLLNSSLYLNSYPIKMFCRNLVEKVGLW
jgi:hypothetical protein